MIWEHYGITRELLQSWGGSMEGAHEGEGTPPPRQSPSRARRLGRRRATSM